MNQDLDKTDSAEQITMAKNVVYDKRSQHKDTLESESEKQGHDLVSDARNANINVKFPELQQ